jgi:hypothetical protein
LLLYLRLQTGEAQMILYNFSKHHLYRNNYENTFIFRI